MISQFKFNADGLIPAIVQDAKSKRVLMMAWMNDRSIRMTLEKGMMVYFSRSRQKYWVKGETSPPKEAYLAQANYRQRVIQIWWNGRKQLAQRLVHKLSFWATITKEMKSFNSRI